MGLFDSIKNKIHEKTHEVHVCYRCGEEYSGLFKGHKLADGQFMCKACFPKMTDLMYEKYVCETFDLYALDSGGMELYFEYREDEQLRVQEFTPTDYYFDRNIIVDKRHGYFKLAQYPEVFLAREIIRLTETHRYEDGKFYVRCCLDLDNWIYTTLTVDFDFRPRAFTLKGKCNELAEIVSEFYNRVCPNARLKLK